MNLKALLTYGIIILFGAGLLTFFVIYTSSSNNNVNLQDNQIVAKIGDLEIPASEINKYYRPELPISDPEEVRRNQLAQLDQVIDKKILEIEAEKRGISVDITEVDEQFNQRKSLYGEESFKEQLERMGITEDMVKEEISHNLLRDQLLIQIRNELSEEITISDEEINTYYDLNKDGVYNISEVAHIYIKIKDHTQVAENEASELAISLINRINNGERFENLARRYSQDSSTKNRGGILGPINTGFLSKVFIDRVMKLEPGEVCEEPLKIQDGFHIIKKVNEKYLDLDQVTEEITTNLKQIKIDDQLRKYWQDVKLSYNIQIFIK